MPQYDLYIEITTLNQKLVTKKNRKARRLRELNPGINCKVFYQRDYMHLLAKYGLERPSQMEEHDQSAPEAANPPNKMQGPGSGAAEDLFSSATE